MGFSSVCKTPRMEHVTLSNIHNLIFRTLLSTTQFIKQYMMLKKSGALFSTFGTKLANLNTSTFSTGNQSIVETLWKIKSSRILCTVPKTIGVFPPAHNIFFFS